MTGLLDRLAELHAAPKNVIEGNLHAVTQAQLDFYFAAHAALPTLLRIAHAAEAVTAHMGPRSRDFAANNATLAELRSALASLGDTPT